VPVVASAPLQPPDAVQPVAFRALHCSVTEPPMLTLLPLDFSVNDGGTVVEIAAWVTETPSEDDPHAARAVSAMPPRIDFNAYADLKRRLRRIDLITRLPG
jgi:hypothetical protein